MCNDLGQSFNAFWQGYTNYANTLPHKILFNVWTYKISGPLLVKSPERSWSSGPCIHTCPGLLGLWWTEGLSLKRLLLCCSRNTFVEMISSCQLRPQTTERNSNEACWPSFCRESSERDIHELVIHIWLSLLSKAEKDLEQTLRD